MATPEELDRACREVLAALDTGEPLDLSERGRERALAGAKLLSPAHRALVEQAVARIYGPPSANRSKH